MKQRPADTNDGKPSLSRVLSTGVGSSGPDYALPTETPKSNTPVVAIPLFLAFALLLLTHSHVSERVSVLMFFLLAGYMFTGTAAAQIRSGYFWRNLADGNRGAHRSSAPQRFLGSNLFHLTLGLSIWLYGIVDFIRHGAD